MLIICKFKVDSLHIKYCNSCAYHKDISFTSFFEICPSIVMFLSAVDCIQLTQHYIEDDK